MRVINNWVLSLSAKQKMIALIVSLFLIRALIIPLEILFIEGEIDSIKISIVTVISAMFIAPLLETFIFQYGAINFVLLFEGIIKKKNLNLTAIFISALFFGLVHGFENFINAFFMGLILAYFYISSKKTGLNGYWFICIGHAIWNGFIILIVLLTS